MNLSVNYFQKYAGIHTSVRTDHPEPGLLCRGAGAGRLRTRACKLSKTRRQRAYASVLGKCTAHDPQLCGDVSLVLGATPLLFAGTLGTTGCNLPAPAFLGSPPVALDYSVHIEQWHKCLSRRGVGGGGEEI